MCYLKQLSSLGSIMYADIDECKNLNGMCEQICEDTDGSYTCQCEPGYVTMEGNPLQCRGSDHPA